jgi:hypothetical protein
MAITRHLAELILAEHRHRPIGGNALLLGRQLVVMTPDQAQALIEKMGIKQASGAYIDYDKTPHPFGKRLISDASFFSLFSDAVVRACDVSDYEGAELIFNLSDGVPSSLLGSFDFIYNGSVLDNVFDPAACIRNVSKMLKPNAVVMHYEGVAHSSPAYLKFSADWFFDYYALNGFADFQGYIAAFHDVHVDPWAVYEWSAFNSAEAPDQLTMPIRLASELMIIAVAQNSPGATWHRTPLQNIYRSNAHGDYLNAHSTFANSPRRRAIRGMFPGAASKAMRSATKSGRWSKLLEVLRWNGRQPPIRTDVPGHIYLGRLGTSKFLASS